MENGPKLTMFSLDKKSWYLLSVGIIILFTTFFATYKLTESPSFWFDEGWYFQSAANIASHGVFGLQLAPGVIEHISMYQTVSYPLIYPLALWLKIFGVSVMSGRSMMVFFILGLVLVGYFLSRRLFGNTVALGTMVLLATFAPLYGNGKSILGEVPGLFYLTLFLLFFNLAVGQNSGRKNLWIFLSGLFAGLCVVTKPFFILLLPAIAIGLFLEWRYKNVSIKQFLFWAIVFLVPVLTWFIVQFSANDSVFDVIRYYSNPYAFSDPNYSKSMIDVIFESFRGLFTNMTTLYTLAILSLWIVAVAIRLFKKEKIPSVEVIAFSFALIVMISYLRIGQIFRYFFPAQIMILVFLPNSLYIIASCLSNSHKWLSVKLGKISVGLLVTAFSIMGIYQLMFSSWVASAYSSHKTEFWQNYFSRISPDVSVLFYDTPEVTPFISSDNYYQIILTIRDNAIGREYLDRLKSGEIDMVIAETSKFEPLRDSIFKNYSEKEVAYKYSILESKH